MNKNEALHAFWSGFSLTAYPANAVPSDVALPYLTYTPISSAFSDGETSVTVNLWYYTDSEAEPNAKAQEISERIGYGGTTVKCDEGFVWLKRGSPFCQSVNEPGDKCLKRRYINITAEFFTIN
jgi:hypothetical protein